MAAFQCLPDLLTDDNTMSSCDARQVRNLREADRGQGELSWRARRCGHVSSLTVDCDNCKLSSAISGSASWSHAFARCLITARRRGQPHGVGHHAANFQTWRIDKRVRHLVRPEKSEREQTHRLALPDARHGTPRAGAMHFLISYVLSPLRSEPILSERAGFGLASVPRPLEALSVHPLEFRLSPG